MLLLAAAPAPHPLPCSQTGGRFSTSLAPAQRKGSGSLPGSPDMGGGVGGGGAGGTTASWSWAQGLPILLSTARSSSLHCPSFAEVQPGPLALCGCLGHPSRSFPTVCKHAGCWVRTAPEPLHCQSRDRQHGNKETAAERATRTALPNAPRHPFNRECCPSQHNSKGCQKTQC